MNGTDYLTRDEVRNAYQRTARIYDLAVWLYYLVGIRVGRYRRLVVEALELRRGDTVVEIGCGTGLNFPLLEQQVGAEGRVIGVDISQAMLEAAKRRVAAAGWRNVEMILCPASEYRFPDRVDGILSTGALTYEPAYDEVIRRGTQALAPGRHWVVMDYKKPGGWLRRLVPLFVLIARPFGVSSAQMDRHPWESMRRYLRNVRIREFYGGFIYLACGDAP